MTVPDSTPEQVRWLRAPKRGRHHKTGRAPHLTVCGLVRQPDWENSWGPQSPWAPEDGCTRCFGPH